MSEVFGEEEEEDFDADDFNAERFGSSEGRISSVSSYQSRYGDILHDEVDESEELLGDTVTDQHLKNISQELGLIKLCWEDVPHVDYEGRQFYPESYYTNNKKERLLLWYAENFRQQFSFNNPSRRPLLIACDNECGVKKMVSTTIRPTTVKFPEFQTWQGCASYVADYLDYLKLKKPTLLPDHINSPETVLLRQAGHCFEFTTLLVSLLVASAYDAYVVSGYATRETCLKDLTRMECPLLVDEPEIDEEEEIEEDSKYFLKKPPSLKSKFLAEMANRELQKEKDAQLAQELAELEAIKEFEKPLPDELWGWRIHSWVVVLPSREVLEPFFIESTTGIAKSLDDPNYHGIESLWNHQNYWVFMQFSMKTETCKDISFDLNNPEHWERFLIGEPFHFRQLSPALADADIDDFKKSCIEAEKHLDMPASWVNFLNISHSDYERRYPNGKTRTFYRKAMAEQFAPYSHFDGLVERVTNFEDYDYMQPVQIKERYKNRHDHMYFCIRTVADNSITEKFERGREDALKERFYYSMDTGIEVKCVHHYYHQARLDALTTLVMDPLYSIVYFDKRPDFLISAHTEFEERTSEDQPLRNILKTTCKYSRNPKKKADEDVAMAEFYYRDRKICLNFHYADEHVSNANREFRKPTFGERDAHLTFDPTLTSGYLTGPNVPEPKPLHLYQLQMEYIKLEEISKTRVRERENELMHLLRVRAQELAAPRLLVSYFDIERNDDAKAAFKAKEQEIRDMEIRDMSMTCDFLAPYYAKFGLSPKAPLSRMEAKLIVNECLKDWKNILVARANDIQQQFEQTCQNFYDKSNWYELNQSTITKEQEEEYFDFCKRNSFYLQILELRLNRHKEEAQRKYQTIYNYLKQDPRVAALFRKK